MENTTVKKQRNPLETAMKLTFMICAAVAVVAIFLICIFIFSNGGPAIFKIGISDFLTGTMWAPKGEIFGILPMICGSLMVTAGALIIGVPIGLMTAIYLACFCPPKIYRVLKPAVELLAGIPSVVFGFFGLMILVPLIAQTLGGSGFSVLATIIILCMMVLPSIINISETSLKAVPRKYYEGALALGANKMEAVMKVVLPAAKSGVMTSVILGIGRAIGETMAVMLVSGNAAIMPQIWPLSALGTTILSPVRTMTAGVALEMGYAAGLHQEALMGIGVVLFLFIILLNLVLNVVIRKGEK